MGKSIRRSLLFVLSLAIIFTLVVRFNVFSKNSNGGEAYYSEAIVVRELGSESDIFKVNADAKLYPASLTKMMTAVVALDYIDDLDGMIKIDKESYQRMVAENSSMAGFLGNEVVSYRDLLYGTMLESGGEATCTLAKAVGGTLENFVDMMNARAVEMGLTNTHFTNVEGLDDENQYTSANDMATLLNYALKNEIFFEVFTSARYISTSTPDHPDGIHMNSTVLKHIEPTESYSILGGKSGTTGKAGLCWATLGEKNGKFYIVVTMKAPLDNLKNPSLYQYDDLKKLYTEII